MRRPFYDMDEDDEEEDDERPLTRGRSCARRPGPRGEGEAEGRDARGSIVAQRSVRSRARALCRACCSARRYRVRRAPPSWTSAIRDDRRRRDIKVAQTWLIQGEATTAALLAAWSPTFAWKVA